jgi:hypothetical protein
MISLKVSYFKYRDLHIMIGGLIMKAMTLVIFHIMS